MGDKKVSFRTTLTQTGATTTGIVVPKEILAQLSAAARPAVVAKVNHYTYRTTVGVMGGKSMLPFSAQHRADSGLSGGDPIEVELSLDLQPRTVEMPQDLETALSAEPVLRAAFLKQAPSRRKADIDNITGAKSPATRARRIAAITAKLKE